MLLPAVFLLFFLFPCTVCDTKLMRVNGKVVGTTQGTLSDSNCLSNCYYNSTCFLVYLDAKGVCKEYSFLDNPKSLSVVSANDGSQVYFKVTLPNDTCPATLNSTNLIYNATKYFSYTWKSTANGWTFPRCADDWHLSVRSENLSVCMRGIPLLDSNRNYAKSFCESINTVLIGTQTVEESMWMTKEVKNKIRVSANFWIDGVRNCSGIEPDCKRFDWSDGLTTGNASMTEERAELSFTVTVGNKEIREDCLVIRRDNSKPINDVSCDATHVLGVFCGYKLN